jgi:hypothetical protein
MGWQHYADAASGFVLRDRIIAVRTMPMSGRELTLQRRSTHIPSFHLYFYCHPNLVMLYYSLLAVRCPTKGERVSCVVKSRSRTKPQSRIQRQLRSVLCEKLLPPLGHRHNSQKLT